MKNKIKDAEENFKKAYKIIESDLKFQKNIFNEIRRGRRLRSTSGLSSDNKLKTIHSSHELINYFDERITKRGKSCLIQNNSEKIMRRQTLFSKNLASQSKRGISNVFDEYFKKFHFIYFQTFCEKLCSDAIKNIGEYHKNKLDSYFSFEDQIKELELLTTGDAGSIFK